MQECPGRGRGLGVEVVLETVVGRHQALVTALNLRYGSQCSLNVDSVYIESRVNLYLNSNLEAGLVVAPVALLGDDDDVSPDLLGVVTKQLDHLRLLLQTLQLLEHFRS